MAEVMKSRSSPVRSSTSRTRKFERQRTPGEMCCTVRMKPSATVRWSGTVAAAGPRKPIGPSAWKSAIIEISSSGSKWRGMWLQSKASAIRCGSLVTLPACAGGRPLRRLIRSTDGWSGSAASAQKLPKP